MQDIVNDVEEMLDHKPEVIRASSRTGKHPLKMDKEAMKKLE